MWIGFGIQQRGIEPPTSALDVRCTTTVPLFLNFNISQFSYLQFLCGKQPLCHYFSFFIFDVQNSPVAQNGYVKCVISDFNYPTKYISYKNPDAEVSSR
jgi:hypothetical protein